MSAMHRGFSPDPAAAGRRRMLVLLRRFARSLPSGMSDEEKASMTAEMARRLERELEGAGGAEGAKGRTHRD
ncbi:MAG: hypothetical protein K6E40_18175 [Desulfovibrio sp.]|nr:hypothetical protein [Desulfovibrio sp.]